MMSEPLESQPIDFDINPNQNKSIGKGGEVQGDEIEVVDSSPASPALAQLEALIKGPLSK